MKRSKRYTAAKETVAKLGDSLDLEKAVKAVQDNAKAKFDESIEVHVRLGVEPGQTDQSVRGSVTFPHGTGKAVRVAAFVESAKETEAKKAGADVIGGEQLIAEIKQKEKVDFDVAVATPTMMPKIAQVARILGPKGLMPNPKSGTVTEEVGKVVTELKKGRTDFRSDDSGNVHVVVGKASAETAHLVENIKAFLEALKKLKPESAKGEFVSNVSVCSTMSPAVRV